MRGLSTQELHHLKIKPPRRISSNRTRIIAGLFFIAPPVVFVSFLFLFNPPQWLAQVLGVAFVSVVLSGLPIVIRLENREKDLVLSRVMLSESEVELFEKWKQSGKLVTKIEGVTENQVRRLQLTTLRVFGTYVAGSGVLRNGKSWERKLPRVGFKVLAAGNHDGAVRFDVILYRRDLASASSIRRPWRQTT